VPTATLALQRAGGVSVTRLVSYLKEKLHIHGFLIRPKIRDDAWEKFIQREPKFFEIKVAPTDSLGSLDIEDDTMRGTIRNLKSTYGGATFRIKVDVESVGQDGAMANPDSLRSGPLRRLVESAIPFIGKRNQVRSLKVGTLNGDDDDIINFLVETVKVDYDVDLPDRDPEKHYQKREALLKRAIKSNVKLDQAAE
jgi:hypothetical protein